MRNNKVVLSLVVVSIAAMASVPELLKQSKSDESQKDVIDLKIKTEGKIKVTTEEQQQLAADVENQMKSIWTKKTPATKVGESVDILISNYGTGDKNIKNKIYDDLKLAQSNNDSTNIVPQGGYPAPNNHPVYNNATPYIACHAACHGACHSACHGSRGWRQTTV